MMRYTPEETMKLPENDRVAVVVNMFNAADTETVRAYGRQLRKLYGDDESFKRLCKLVAGELLMRYGRVTFRSQRYSESWSWSAWSTVSWSTTV